MESRALRAEADAPVVLRVVPRPRVTGRVTAASGRPIADARIDILQEIPRTTRGSVPLGFRTITTDHEGRYECTLHGRSGSFQMRVLSPRHLTSVSAPVTLVDGNDEYMVDLVVRRGPTLTGTVEDTSGDPLPGVLIRVGPEKDGRHSWHVPVQTASGADGSFEVKGAPADKLTLHASKPGYRPVKLTVDAAAPTHVVLQEARRITGVVRRRNGAPVPGVTVTAYPAGDGRWDIYFIVRPEALRSDGIPGSAEAITDAEGRFVLLDLAEGGHRLLVKGAPLRPVRDHVVNAGTENTVVTVEPAGKGKYGALTDEDIGRSARYLAMQGKHEKAAELWRALLARQPDPDTRVSALVELGRTLEARKKNEEWESVLREAASLAPASTSRGLDVRYNLAKAVLALGRAREALAIADEVAAGRSVDAGAAARGGFVAVMCFAELGEIDAARKRLDLVGHEVERLRDASLDALMRDALFAVNRKR